MTKERADLDNSKYNNISLTLVQQAKMKELGKGGYRKFDAPPGYETAHASNALYLRSPEGQIVVVTATGDVVEARCVKEVKRTESVRPEIVRQVVEE